jgi:hypothetical protein
VIVAAVPVVIIGKPSSSAEVQPGTFALVADDVPQAEPVSVDRLFPDESVLREIRIWIPQVAADGEQESVAEAEQVTVVEDPRIEQIRRFYGSKPLAPYAAVMVEAADAWGIDWRLIPVISILESSGGVNVCGRNAWGYASCRVRFSTFEEGIHKVAETLAKPPYTGRSTAAVLCIWVSGKPCTNDHGLNYAYKAASLYAALGGGFPLPPRPATQQVVATPAAAPVLPSPAAEPTPTPTTAAASPSPAPSPTAAPEPTAEPSATPTPGNGSGGEGDGQGG